MNKLFDEQILIKQILQGQPRAARKFYHHFHPRIRAYVISRTQCEEDAEEIVQDTFLAAIESLPLYSGKSSVATWIYGIARHEISDYYRKKRVKTLLMSRVPILKEILGDEDWKSAYDRLGVQSQISQVLNNILPRYAQILRMKYLEGWSVKDIAREFDESLKSTETALFRARKAFALEWGKLNFE